jgi:hypothetical protein
VANDSWKQTLLAPDFTVADWYGVCDQLDPDRYDRRWQRVIGRIRLRLRKRFLDPADALIGRDKRFRRIAEGPGFAVLAIDCILIETLFGYERGAHTAVGGTGPAFITFLTQTPCFAKDFGLGDRAAAFGPAVRNGVLHDGETRKGWTVWKGSDRGPLVVDLSDGRRRVYRDAFHAAVKAYVNDYFVRLKTRDDPTAATLRLAFKERVNGLCRDCAPPGVPVR